MVGKVEGCWVGLVGGSLILQSMIGVCESVFGCVRVCLVCG